MAGWPEWVTPKIRDAMHMFCDFNKQGAPAPPPPPLPLVL